MLFWLCYMVLVPLQLHAIKIQKHPVTKLFTASLLLDFLALCLILMHALKFSMDGVGYPKLSMAGDIFDILSRVRYFDVEINTVVSKEYNTCLKKISIKENCFK